jgi:hypothetical protein
MRSKIAALQNNGFPALNMRVWPVERNLVFDTILLSIDIRITVS